MNYDGNAGMIAELSRIAARYGPDSLTGLANLIRDPKRAEELAVVLETVAAQSPRARSKPRKTIRPPGMGVLSELRKTDPEKHSLVAEIREHLIAGTALHSMDGLRHFARTHDLSIGKASSRKSAIAPFLRSISELPTPRVLELRDLLVQYNGDDDRSLERWRSLIVRPRPSETLQ